jgi:hypothetical protein
MREEWNDFAACVGVCPQLFLQAVQNTGITLWFSGPPLDSISSPFDHSNATPEAMRDLLGRPALAEGLTMSTVAASTSPHLAWHVLYQAALFEPDANKIPQRIAEAENAILSRIKELFVVTTDHIEEDIVLDDALYAMRALRSCVASERTAA